MSYPFSIFFTIFFLLMSNVHAQKNGHKKESILYYFCSPDSAFVGVKDQLGNIIIPATHRAGFNYDFEHPIIDPVIEFQDTDAQPDRKDSPAIPIGDIYNREGKLLYHAQLFDNGLDYYSEGFRRYVDSGKIGFVDRYGNKVIPAQWNFATPFHYGYSRAYSGKWKRKYDKSGEHWTVVPDAPDADTHMINVKGEKVSPLAKQQNPKDYFSDGNYYPYPFSYTAKEQKIADQLNSLEVLSLIARLRFSDEQQDTPRLQFEITEWPTSHFPYYTLQGYQNQRAEDDYIFTVSEDGKNIFHYSFFITEEHPPLQKWVVSELEECKKYIRNHPNAPYRFDVKKHLKEWKNK